MKFMSMLCGLFSFSIATAAAESQCDKIANQALAGWRQWADAPENNHTSKFTVKYQDVEFAKAGLVLPAKSGNRFVSNVDPMSVSIELKNAAGTRLLMITPEALRMREDPATRTSEIIVPNAVVDLIKGKTNNNPEGSELTVTYYQRKDSGFMKNLNLAGIVKNYSSSNGRNAQVVTAENKTIAVLVPEPKANSYKAILFSDNCQIKQIVYQDGKTLTPGPTRGDCMTINHKASTGKTHATDARAMLDCNLYYNWLSTEKPAKGSRASGALGGS